MEEKIKAILAALEGVRYIDWKRIATAIERQYTSTANRSILDKEAINRAIAIAVAETTRFNKPNI